MVALKFLIVNLSLFLFYPAENEWELSLEKDDISIFTREVEFSNFDEFLAEAKMTGTINDFKKIIIDIEHYYDWVPDCKSIEILENPNPGNITYHMKLKVPFPFAKRDIVQQIILNETENKLEVLIQNHPNKVKREKKYVRMLQAHGKWTIQEISKTEILIRFQYFADPGGDIPAWLVNSFIVKNPHLSLVNMRKLMED